MTGAAAHTPETIFEELQLRKEQGLGETFGTAYKDVLKEINSPADVAEILKRNRFPDSPGRLYQVELAPKEDEYLDWDKPLYQQSPKIRAALRKVSGNEFWDDADKASTIYHALAKELGGAKEGYPTWVTGPDYEAASKALLAGGIPGIKYLQGASRRFGDGAHNFVIFDDKLVKIKSWESRGKSFEETPQDRTPFKPQMHEGYAKAIDEVEAAVKSGDRARKDQALSKLIPVGRTPVVLRQVLTTQGSKPFKKSEFVLGQGSTLYLKGANEHQASEHIWTVPTDILKRLPELLANPVAVFQSSDASSDPNSYKIMLDAQVAGKPVVAALRANQPQQKLGGEKAHFTVTVFPLAGGMSQVNKWNEDGLLRYFDDRRAAAGTSGTNPQGLTAERGAKAPDWSMGVSKSAVKVVTKQDIEWMPKELYSRGTSFEESPAAYPEELQHSTNTITDYVKDAVTNWAKKGLQAVAFSHDLADIAVKEGLRSARGFFDLLNQKSAKRVRLEAELDRILTEAADLPDRTAVNSFLQASTMAQAWGYVPTWKSDALTTPAMERLYKALSPEGRKVVDQVFKYGEDTYADTQRLVNKEINDEFDRQLLTAGAADERSQIENERSKRLSTVGRVMPKLQGPYAPLKRFGDYVMVAKSARYAAAQEKEQAELQADPNHYVVEFFDSIQDAKARARQMAPYFPGGNTEGFEKQKIYKDVQELPWGAIAKVKHAIEDMPDGTKHKSAMTRLLTDLYLSLLSESSARKAELKRRGVQGAERDMLRSFASQGRASAHFLAALEHNGDVQKKISAMQTEARDGAAGTRENRSRVFNEVMARYAQGLDYRPTPISDKLMRLTSVWMLLTSPAYYLQNSTQPFMLTLPVLSGRFGNGAAWASLTKAYKDVGRIIKSAGHTLDIDKLPLSEDEKAMLTQMRNAGRIDVTMSQDLGRWTHGESKFDKGTFGKVIRTVNGLTQRVEMVNRVTSALAAYRLSKGNLDYVGKILDQTHGNYAASNAPRFMQANGAMRLVTQFRKYQLIQVSLLARLTKDAFAGANAEEKAVARAALGYVLAHHMVMAGALGLPAVNIVGFVLSFAFGDPDEPRDFEHMVRKAVDDKDLANLLLYGAPAAVGINLSGRIGMGNAFAVLPYTNIDLTSRKGLAETAMGAAGPFMGGVAPKLADGIGYIRKGDYYKGIEAMMPRGLSDAMKAYRIGTEGLTQKNNDVVMKPSEVEMYDVMSQAMGLPSLHLTDRGRRLGDLIETETYYKDRVSELKHEYSAAYRDNDVEGMTDAREQWARMAEGQKRNGFKPSPLSTLLKAPGEQGKREKQVVEGIEVKKSNRRFVEEDARI